MPFIITYALKVWRAERNCSVNKYRYEKETKLTYTGIVFLPSFATCLSSHRLLCHLQDVALPVGLAIATILAWVLLIFRSAAVSISGCSSRSTQQQLC